MDLPAQRKSVRPLFLTPSRHMVAIALGDPTGIGPEITLKAVAAELPRDDARYLLLGDVELIHRLNGQLQTGLVLGDATSGHRERVTVANPSAPLPARLPQGSPEAARAAVAWIKHGAHLCLRGEASALVTAPVNKEAIIRAGETGFVGQTELLSALAGSPACRTPEFEDVPLRVEFAAPDIHTKEGGST